MGKDMGASLRDRAASPADLSPSGSSRSSIPCAGPVAEISDDMEIDLGGEIITWGAYRAREETKKTDPAFRLEFRPDYKGKFDEIIARKPDMVHVETMSSKSVYIGFHWDDGRYCQLWISSDKKLSYHHEDGLRPPASAIEVAKPSMPQASTEGESAVPEGGDAHAQ